MTSELEKNDLAENEMDGLAAVARSLAGAVPFVGTFLGEVITDIIPNQRMDRFQDYMVKLAQHLAALQSDIEKMKEQINQRPFLIELGGNIAARSTEEEIRNYLARCTAFGITAKEDKNLLNTKLIELLSELDEFEISTLIKHHNDAHSEGNSSMHRNRLLFSPFSSENQNVDEVLLFRMALNKLQKLGLLYFIVKPPQEGFKGNTFIDQITNNPSGWYGLSHLGESLLRSIGAIQLSD